MKIKKYLLSALLAMNIRETHREIHHTSLIRRRARSLLTLGRSCKPSLLRNRFRMQQAVMHGFKD